METVLSISSRAMIGLTKGHIGSVQWLRKMKKSFPLTPPGAERVARGGFVSVPLLDKHIRLETHLATLVSNESRLISEYVRSFMKRIEEESPPAQLQLPIN